jgi:hypothetical protein
VASAGDVPLLAVNHVGIAFETRRRLDPFDVGPGVFLVIA